MIISFFTQKGGDCYSREGDYSREVIISNKLMLTGSDALNILFYFPINEKKIITTNKLNMGFLSVPNLVHS